MVDVAVVSEAVAGLLAVGGVKELGETAGGGLISGIIDRVKKVFGSDARSVDTLDRTRQGEPGAVAELASALAWYARRDQTFAGELATWAAQAGSAGGVTQQVHAGRDAYVAGRDQTVNNYRRPGELDRWPSVPGNSDADRPDPQVRQDIYARRDAYTAGQYQAVINFPPAGRPELEVPQRAWGNVPARNLGFTGREVLLDAVRTALVSGDRAVVQALRGMGGIGKTQLATEYAYRYATEYDVVWWINAAEPELISSQFSALAAELGCAETAADPEDVRARVLNVLRARERWLLVFDSAESSEHITGWLPGGTGHVLITSRAHGWDEVAVSVEIDVMARGESITLLRRRVPTLSKADADLVAEAVGDLPLALAQAAAYMSPAGMPALDYVRLVEERAAEILDTGRPSSYPLSLAAVTQLALDRLQAADLAAAQAVRICAFLAPEPVPTKWFTNAGGQLAEPLGTAAADPLAWGLVLGRISGQALARIDSQELLTHRLTQAIIRTCLSAGEADAARQQAAELLAASRPGKEDLPSNWPAWARLLPHLLALDPDASTAALSGLTRAAIWYLHRRGLALKALDLARKQHQHLLAWHGPDHPDTLLASTALAAALHSMGRYAEGRALNEDNLARFRRVRGEDHQDTLHAAGNLAVYLRRMGEYQAARELDEDTLARFRRVLGADHPDTLKSASNLAISLYALGEHRAARELAEDTLARRRRVLGDDHPDTLRSAGNLAVYLHRLGEHRAARELDEDTLARRRRVLGDDHPDTQGSARNLHTDPRAFGALPHDSAT